MWTKIIACINCFKNSKKCSIVRSISTSIRVWVKCKGKKTFICIWSLKKKTFKIIWSSRAIGSIVFRINFNNKNTLWIWSVYAIISISFSMTSMYRINLNAKNLIVLLKISLKILIHIRICKFSSNNRNLLHKIRIRIKVIRGKLTMFVGVGTWFCRWCRSIWINMSFLSMLRKRFWKDLWGLLTILLCMCFWFLPGLSAKIGSFRKRCKGIY